MSTVQVLPQPTMTASKSVGMSPLKPMHPVDTLSLKNTTIPSTTSSSIDDNNIVSNSAPIVPTIKNTVSFNKASTERVKSLNNIKKQPGLKRTKSCPEMKYDDCREFDAFAGEWTDSKGQTVLISPWGVIRYPNNAKLRFEAIYMGPNHLSVTFDKDPKRRKFVGKLNHDCELLIWSNDTKWVKKASQYDPDGQNKKRNGKHASQKSCLIQ